MTMRAIVSMLIVVGHLAGVSSAHAQMQTQVCAAVSTQQIERIVVAQVVASGGSKEEGCAWLLKAKSNEGTEYYYGIRVEIDEHKETNSATARYQELTKAATELPGVGDKAGLVWVGLHPEAKQAFRISVQKDRSLFVFSVNPTNEDGTLALETKSGLLTEQTLNRIISFVRSFISSVK